MFEETSQTWKAKGNIKMRIVYLLILLLTVGYSSDDLNHLKGRWMVNGSINYSSIAGDNDIEVGYQTELNVGPTYFALDYLGLSLSGFVSTRRGKYLKQETYGLSPSVLFVFPLSYGSSTKKIYPNLSVGYGYSETYMYGKKYYTSEGVRLQAGIFFFLNKNVAVRPYYSYSESKSKYPGWSSSDSESKHWINTSGISLAIFI